MSSILGGHKCVLITGGCGAIGSEVINYLKLKYSDTLFVNFDSLTYAGNASNIEPPYANYRFFLGDICRMDDVSRVLVEYQPTLVIHFAAESHVDSSFGNSLKFTETNVMGTHMLLECIRMNGEVRNVMHMSTDEVYGSVVDDLKCLETTMFKPSNPYSASKAAAEMLCNAYMMSFRIPITIIRCNNALSKYQHTEKLVPKCVECIMNGELIPVHGNGQSRRTFVDVEDIARAFETLILRGRVNEIYNIGTDHEYSVMEVISEIVSLMKPGDPVARWVKFVPDRDFQDYRYSVDAQKLRDLGWASRISFKDSIRRIVSHTSGVDSI